MTKTIIPPLVLRNFLFIILIVTKAHELLGTKKYHTRAHVRVSKKPLSFDNLDATQIFLPEKNIQSILFSFLAQLDFTIAF